MAFLERRHGRLKGIERRNTLRYATTHRAQAVTTRKAHR